MASATSQLRTGVVSSVAAGLGDLSTGAGEGDAVVLPSTAAFTSRPLKFVLEWAAPSAAVSVFWPKPAHAFDGGNNGGGHQGNGGWGGGDGGNFGSGGVGSVPSITTTYKSSSRKPVAVTIVSFAVTKALYEQLTKMFAQEWQRQTGQPVRFRLSFGGSGTQARAVIDGLPADIVALALPLDVLKIQEAGLIGPDWRTRVPNNAVNAESVVCIMTGPGNPKRISKWEDLTRQDVSVLTANPKTAGVARWNFVALWGSVSTNHRSDGDAKDFVEKVFLRVPVQPRDAREASDVFFHQQPTDCLITYENEAVVANEVAAKEGKAPLPFVIPEPNVAIENVVAVVDKNAKKSGTREVCDAFVQFLFTPAAQRVVAEKGFRPVHPEVVEEYRWKYPAVEKLWRVDDQLGNWSIVHEKFFHPGGVFDQIENEVQSYRLQALRA